MKTQATSIEPGIYRHYCGNLYFVLALGFDREDPTNLAKADVIYHPLCQVNNLNWRDRISPKKFLEHVARGNYSGPRFTKIMDWEDLNILPGKKFRDRAHPSHGAFTIQQVVEKSTGEIVVEATAPNLGPVSIPIEAFSLKIQMVV